jgi:hypothetical protein
MAVLSVPQWSLEQIVTLPAASKVTFKVIPGVFAQKGIAIEYVLHSKRAQFQDGAVPPALREDERTGSQPTVPDLVPRERSTILVVDRIPGAKPNDTVSITRTLSLSAVTNPSPGIASITVTVSDVRLDDTRTDGMVQSATIVL